MFNMSEFIEDCMAMGQTRSEAVAAAREELALRNAISQRNRGREYNDRKERRHDRATPTR